MRSFIKEVKIAEKFVCMVYNYAKELQRNTDKYVMKYISEIVKLAVQRNLVSLEDLYTKREKDICDIFAKNFLSWSIFNEASTLVQSEVEPNDVFFISFDAKKRNAIPLIQTPYGSRRITEVSDKALEKYNELREYKDSKYAYVKKIRKIY